MYWVPNILLSFLTFNSIYKIFVEHLIHTKAHSMHLGWTKEQNRPCSYLNSWLWPTVSSVLSCRKDGTEERKQRWCEKYIWVSAWKSFWIFDLILKIMWPINLLRYYGWFFFILFFEIVFSRHQGHFYSTIEIQFWLKQTEKSHLGWREDSEGGVILTGDVWRNYMG